MATDRVTPNTQPQYSALLRYFHSGDFASLTRIADLAYGNGSSSEPYFCANLLFASQVCGLCELSNASGNTQWWVSHSENIAIQSPVPKVIGTTAEWFSRHEGQTLALVTDSNLRPLVLGSRKVAVQGGETSGIFDLQLPSLVPAFKDIETELCSEVPFVDDVAGNAEAYNASAGRWDAISLEELTGSKLFRVRKEYSGVAYYVQHSELGLRFRITQPEWAFVVAYHLLPWRLGDIMRIEHSTIRFHRTVRMPILMYRLLFAAADALRIGPQVTFENVKEPCIEGFLKYFGNAGERH
jgi:hypothetical protein